MHYSFILLSSFSLAISSIFLINYLSCSKEQPIVGIYAQPSHFKGFPTQQYQYVLSSYIYWIEISGGKAIVIPFDETKEYYDKLMPQINGLLFTGGSVNININTTIEFQHPGLNQWTENAKYIIDKSIHLNNIGSYFPVFGTCQGFQLLSYVASGLNYTILHHLDNDFNVTRNVLFENIEKSKMMKGVSQELIHYSQYESPFLYLHELSVVKEDFISNPKLTQFFNIIGLSKNSTSNRNAFEYVSIIEGKKMPFYGVQFHTEYTLFENSFDSNDSSKSLEINKHFSEFFAKETQKNRHQFFDLEQKNTLLEQGNNFSLLDDKEFKQAVLIERKY